MGFLCISLQILHFEPVIFLLFVFYSYLHLKFSWALVLLPPF